MTQYFVKTEEYILPLRVFLVNMGKLEKYDTLRKRLKRAYPLSGKQEFLEKNDKTFVGILDDLDSNKAVCSVDISTSIKEALTDG